MASCGLPRGSGVLLNFGALLIHYNGREKEEMEVGGLRVVMGEER